MRFAVLHSSGGLRFVRLDGDRAVALSRAPWEGEDAAAVRRETSGAVGESWVWSEGDLRCPIRPSKIVCVGRNYAAHARELGHDIPSEPLLFLKAPSALVGPGDTIRLPPESTRVEHEAELAVVIGRRAKNVASADAFAHVLGYTCACDVTARDLQRKDVQFTRSKSFDTFCPIGPWIETELDPATLRIRCRVDGETRQDGPTTNMLFDVPTVVSFASRMMTLEPGDVILTGTPEGVGPLVTGNTLEVEISGIGTLRLRVGV